MKTFPKKLAVIALSAALTVILAVGFLVAFRPGVPRGFARSTLCEVEEISQDQLARLDPIVIRFKEPIPAPDAIAKAATFTPKVAGSWSVRDDRTVEFTPEAAYRDCFRFSLAVDTGLLKGKEGGAEGFVARYSVRPASFSVECEGLYAENDDSSRFSLSGTVTTDIPVSERTARSLVTAGIGKRAKVTGLSIEWERAGTTDAKAASAGDSASKAWRFAIRHVANGP